MSLGHQPREDPCPECGSWDSQWHRPGCAVAPVVVVVADGVPGAITFNQQEDTATYDEGLDPEEQMVSSVLEVMGVDNTDTHFEQLWLMLRAFNKFVGRNARYGDQVWQASGSRGQLTDLRKKLDRMWMEYWNGGGNRDMDSAEDMINYIIFFIRCHLAGNRDGIWPWGLTMNSEAERG